MKRRPPLPVRLVGFGLATAAEPAFVAASALVLAALAAAAVATVAGDAISELVHGHPTRWDR